MEFEIDDVVEINDNGCLFRVVGVIHDNEKLYLATSCGEEFSVDFSSVTERWSKKDLW